MVTTAIQKARTSIAVFAGCCAMALLFALTFGASQAWAGGQPGNPCLEDLGGKTYVVSLKTYADVPSIQSYASAKSPEKKISGVKSSNPKVATAQAAKGGPYYYLCVDIKKTGTTKITFKQGGKKHTVKYIVKAYKNPVTSFKLGDKNYASKFDPENMLLSSVYTAVGVNAKTLKGKVQLKPASGWKVKKIWYWNSKAKMKFVKNGGKISNGVTAYVWLQKGTQREIFELYKTK